MEMGSTETAGTIEPKGEIFTCQKCGYTDGFHVSFRVAGSASEAEVYLICPSCHRRYRIGWKLQLQEHAG
jgi:RNase P subunit RPR2